MKIHIAQQNYHLGNITYNKEKIIAAIQSAKQAKSDLIIFPELAICGYAPNDLLEFPSFIQQCTAAINEIAQYTDKSIAALIGGPSINPVIEGKDLFNSAYFLHNGKIEDIIHKTLLPNYDVFDEYRYFEPAFEQHILTYQGQKLAVTICEDIWDIEENPLYKYRPIDKIMDQNPAIIINLSASPFSYTHAANRKTILKRNADLYKIPIIYCNTWGAHAQIVFDGGSMVMDGEGNIIKELPFFEEALDSIIWDGANNFREEKIIIPHTAIKNAFSNPATFDPHYNIAGIHQALLTGIQDYFKKMGFQRAIIASSGGIDSALTLALACEALGAANVDALLLPSAYSTQHSIDDAIQLSKNTGNPYYTLSIANVYDTALLQLQPFFNNLPFNVAEENLQSRIRGLLTMAFSNKFNTILLNTSNKSELATGYGTLYGDMAGGLGILGDLYKEQVYALAQYINRNGEIIPKNIIEKAPSAELRPDQKDSDSLPPYSILDQILYLYIDRRQSAVEIADKGFAINLVESILKMVNNAEFKRHQFCPIIRISAKAFGSGRRMPIVAKYAI